MCLLQIRVPKLTSGLFFHRFSAVSRRALSTGKFYKGLAYKLYVEVIASMTTVSYDLIVYWSRTKKVCFDDMHGTLSKNKVNSRGRTRVLDKKICIFFY